MFQNFRCHKHLAYNTPHYIMFVVFLFTFILIHSTQTKPTFDAKEHLHSYGFLNTTNPDSSTFENAIKKFQMVNQLTVTGTLNEDTLHRMKAPRCGRPSHIPAFAYSSKDRWSRSGITYKIYNVSKQFTRNDVKQIFEEAIKVWTNNVNLKITETNSNKADIIIYFTQQDKATGVLGYAYFPENGDIFFDQDEDWTLDKSLAVPRTYFGWVAAHELGHSLGLPHSETMQSIMFPYYSSKLTLPADIDTNSLRAIYGQATMNKTVLCDGTSVDAILDTRDPLLIRGKQYWTISDGVIQSGPTWLDLLFPGLTDKVDAAFMVGKRSYFLSGNRFYRFSHNTKPFKSLSPKLISVGFDKVPPHIDAAFYDSSSSVIYFFKGSKYYALHSKKPSGKRLLVNGKDISNDWLGVPDDIEAATLINGSEVLFIKDSKCYVVELSTRELLHTENCLSTLYKC